tara:strand:- start:1667 stop:2428 length:762 start_codon:yes stop_codon:yes gene_type:complete
MKINIFYRHYNSVDDRFNGQGKHSTIFNDESTGESIKVPIRPKWFSYEDCFRNLLDTIKGKDVELHLIMDGDVEKGFMKNYKDHFTLHTIKAGSDQRSFNKTWEVAKSLETKDDELFYFLENDYLHVSHWVDNIIDVFETNPDIMHYISLYDHNDKYILASYQDLVSRVVIFNNQHWRSTPSTCGSFIIGKSLLKEDYDIQTSFNGDHEKFLHLNNIRGRCVLSPIPSLSSHCMSGLEAPIIDWETINNKTKI